MASASIVANYLLTLVCEEEGDLMSNLKLQKLLYYVQGFHLAIEDEPLFDEQLCAWKHGPVVPDVYKEYSVHGPNAIPCPENVSDQIEAELTERQREIIADVYREYGQYEASALRRMTHAEPPWRQTANLQVIRHDALSEYFATQVTRE